jgi:tripartite-type tricarboxylate transporter receptor subunit TctC
VLVPAVEKAIKNPELKAKIEKLYFVVDYRSPAQLKKMIAAEHDQAVAVAKSIGLYEGN